MSIKRIFEREFDELGADFFDGAENWRSESQKPTTEQLLIEMLHNQNNSLLQMANVSELNNSQIEENSVQENNNEIVVSETTTNSEEQQIIIDDNDVSNVEVNDQSKDVASEEKIEADFSIETFEMTDRTIDLINKLENQYKYPTDPNAVAFNYSIRELKRWKESLSCFKNYDELIKYILYYNARTQYTIIDSEEVIFFHILYTLPHPWEYTMHLSFDYKDSRDPHCRIIKRFFEDLDDYNMMLAKCNKPDV